MHIDRDQLSNGLGITLNKEDALRDSDESSDDMPLYPTACQYVAAMSQLNVVMAHFVGAISEDHHDKPIAAKVYCEQVHDIASEIAKMSKMLVLAIEEQAIQTIDAMEENFEKMRSSVLAREEYGFMFGVPETPRKGD